MGTTAQKLQAILNSKTAIKMAIEAKGVTVADAPLREYAEKISDISGGGGGGGSDVPEGDVNFYDYDGKRIASYTITEAKALTELPTPPSHEGLTFQGWNWSLSDIQSYNRRYADIGANYITTDGKTHLKFKPLGTDVIMNFMGKNGTITVYWGDESSAESYTYGSSAAAKRFTHTYSEIKEYEVTIGFVQSADDGCYGMNSRTRSTDWSDMELYEVNIGNYYNALADCAFGYANLVSLSLSLPTSVAFDIKTNFVSCSDIKILAIPRSVTDLSNLSCSYCRGRISFPKSCSDYSGLAAYFCTTNRIILPECTDNTKQLRFDACQYNILTSVWSLPLSLDFTTRTQGDFFNNSLSMMEIDVPQGFTFKQNTRLNYNSNRWTAANIVKFFERLGTAPSAVTLTFGNATLNKLTTEQKAVATDKGYTLA